MSPESIQHRRHAMAPKERDVVTSYSEWESKRKIPARNSKTFVADRWLELIGEHFPFLTRFGILDGTMPIAAQVTLSYRVTRWTDAYLRGASQVVFASNPLSGLFILTALFVPVSDGGTACVGVCGLLGLFSSTATALFMGLDNNSIQGGLFGYNGFLTGLGAATFLAGAKTWSAGPVVASLIYGSVSTLLQIVWGNVLVPTFKCPPFTLAFNMANILLSVGAFKFTRFQQAAFLAPSILPPDAPPSEESLPNQATFWILESALVSVGQIFLCNSAWSGALILAGTVFNSRILAIALYCGALAGVLIALLLGAPTVEIESGLWGYNASLGAAAVMMFFYPNGVCCVMALFCTLVCVLLDSAFKALVAPLGMPVGTYSSVVGPLCSTVSSPNHMVTIPALQVPCRSALPQS